MKNAPNNLNDFNRKQLSLAEKMGVNLNDNQQLSEWIFEFSEPFRNAYFDHGGKVSKKMISGKK